MSKQKFYDKPLFGMVVCSVFGIICLTPLFFPEILTDVSIPSIGIASMPAYIIEKLGPAGTAIVMSLFYFVLALIVGISNRKQYSDGAIETPES